MRNLKIISLLIVFLFSVTIQAEASFKASDLKAHCESSWTRTGNRDKESDMINQAVCVSYIEGYRNGVLAMFRKFELYKKKEKTAEKNVGFIRDKIKKKNLEDKTDLSLLFGCVPYKTLNRVNYSATRNMFSKYLSKHPELMEKPVGEALTATLLDYFCAREEVDEFDIEKSTIEVEGEVLKIDEEISFDEE